MAIGECIFCAIVKGQAEASIVYEDDAVAAFMDLQPVTPGHVLVVPKAHAVGLEDLDETLGCHMWAAAHRLARALRRSDLRLTSQRHRPQQPSSAPPGEARS
ncbi:HIT family protein [Streptomyces sp. NPDC056479]|uniref:HIT family protein n=1 Tax=Streptomyces sp. NPDC056479 TaxID=3345832 RepID=UPI00368FE617